MIQEWMHQGFEAVDAVSEGAAKCPFCSSETAISAVALGVDEDGALSWLVTCDDCGAQGPFDDDVGGAVSRWNNGRAAIKGSGASYPLCGLN